MSRIRTVKPQFFKHEGLFDAEIEHQLPLRLAFAGLWTCADREGRFKWRPRSLRSEIFPYDDIDFSRVLDALATCGFIVKYENSRELYGYIPSWKSHQVINNKEKESLLPAPDESDIDSAYAQSEASLNPLILKENSTREARVDDALTTCGQTSLNSLNNSQGEGKGKEGEYGKELEATSVASCSELKNLAHEPEIKPVISLLLNTGKEYPLPQSKLDEFQELYPAVDVMQELREIKAWCINNPKKRKTKAGVLRFINSWLAREQDKPRLSQQNFGGNKFTQPTSNVWEGAI